MTHRRQAAGLPLTATGTDFRPAWWCRTGHAQTIYAGVLRPRPRLALRRERWETPDGDFLDMDFTPGEGSRGIMLVLHGLESASDSRVVRGLLSAAHADGWLAAAMNFRSCSGEPNRLACSYHAGHTADVAWVAGRLAARFSGRPMCCVGFSLGGNVLLKYLGEHAAAAPSALCAAVAVSAPFDLGVSARAFERRGLNRLYGRLMTDSLKQKALVKARQFPGMIDESRLAAVRTVAEFDDLVSGPVNGFSNAEAYWLQCSCAQFLPSIRRPTLLINALDDPLVPSETLPYEALAGNGFLTALFPAGGGHAGFINGPAPWRPICWADEQALAFCRSHAARQGEAVPVAIQ